MFKHILFLIVLFVVPQLALADVSVGIQDQLKSSLKVEKFKLDNGLTVIMHEDHTIPMVAYHQWFKVGSHMEKPEQTGLAHFFEHLVFKGTEKYPGEAYEGLINGSGGANNAFTTRDYTGYYTLIPTSRLETIIDIEADRMVNLIFDPVKIDKERGAVKNERLMRYDNNPSGRLYEMLYSTVFKTSPYRWPVIGYMKDLNAAKMADFKEFYQTYYAPNNAVIVVSGSFSSSKVKSWIEEYYGELKPKKIPETKFPKETAQKSRRVNTHKMDLQSARMVLAYKSANAYDPDEYALSMLSDVLAGGETSRLYRALVRKKQLLTSVSSSQLGGKLEGLFGIWASLRPGASRQQVVSGINSEIKKLQKTEVSDDEMERARNSIMLGYTQALKTAAGKARILAYSEIIYEDPTAFFKDLDKYAAVTKADIMRVAKKYLNTSQQSSVAVVPK